MARKMKMKKATKFATLLTVVTALTACGGGGGAGAPTPNAGTGTSAASPAPIAPVPATTVVTVTAPGTYAVGSEQANVFALLNQERTKCGFGALQQDSKLDQSAGAHAKFLTENGTYYGHDEAPGLPFFTGTTEGARALAAGYQNPVGADLATYAGPAGVPGQLRTTSQFRDLMAAPFHLLSLIDSFADAGVGYVQKIKPQASPPDVEINALNISLGRRAGVNDLDPDQVYTYPCQSSVGVNSVLTRETPSPIPSNLSQNNKLFGTPIAVKVRTGRVLVVTSGIVTPTAGGPSVAVQIVSQANTTPRPDLMRATDAYLLPLSVLQPGTSYTVQIAGKNDGQPFSHSFSFTTAN